jgi:hypothetical protein
MPIEVVADLGQDAVSRECETDGVQIIGDCPESYD